MSTDDPWRPLIAELDGWKARGQPALFWLRDDDAVVPSAALDRLLDATGRFSIPLTLAVIPEKTGSLLTNALDRWPHVSVALHGWSHRNHAPSGQKNQELGPHRPIDEMLAELHAGVGRLSRLHGARFVPLLVPPWNRIDPTLLPHLGGIGLSALSVFGPEQPGPIRSVNCHVDLIDWRGTRGGRDPATLIAEIIARLRGCGPGGGPVGVLTHHLVHDEAAWGFLDELFACTTQHPACRWVPIAEILADGSPATGR